MHSIAIIVPPIHYLTGMGPAEVLFGRPMQIKRGQLPTITVPCMDDELQHADDAAKQTDMVC